MKTYRKRKYISGFGFFDLIKNVATNIPYKQIGHTLVPYVKKGAISLANSASERIGHNIGEKVGDVLAHPRTDDKKLQEVREKTLKDLELLPHNQKTKNRNKILQELKINDAPISALYGGSLKNKKKIKGGMIRILK